MHFGCGPCSALPCCTAPRTVFTIRTLPWSVSTVRVVPRRTGTLCVTATAVKWSEFYRAIPYREFKMFPYLEMAKTLFWP